MHKRGGLGSQSVHVVLPLARPRMLAPHPEQVRTTLLRLRPDRCLFWHPSHLVASGWELARSVMSAPQPAQARSMIFRADR